MNCENFNNRLPEYLDETLSIGEQDAAREHVEKCGECRRVLAREEAFAKSVRLSFDRETQELSLRAETRRNILDACKQPTPPPAAWESIQKYFAILWRQSALGGALLLCLLLLIGGAHFHRDPAKNPSSQSAAHEARNTYVFDVPIQTENHVYRLQNNMVVDAVVTGASVIRGSFSENIRPGKSSQLRIN